MSMLHTILPLSFVASPAPACPIHSAKAFFPVLHEMADILHTILPQHLSFTRHAVLLELTSVDRAISAHQLSNAIRTALLKLPSISGAFWPSHDAISVPHAFHVGSSKEGAIRPHFLALATSLIIPPLALIPRAIWELKYPETMPCTIHQVPFVQRVVRIPPLAFPGGHLLLEDRVGLACGVRGGHGPICFFIVGWVSRRCRTALQCSFSPCSIRRHLPTLATSPCPKKGHNKVQEDLPLCRSREHEGEGPVSCLQD
mmetsp:Transcript_54239/g.100249  ORF Transcript_54239/g.100249 Transcript_54239/m.100249 type:complete len:257 (+) Transcript_54239:223-993(+)